MTAEFFVAGGTLRSDAPSYIERSADADLRQHARAGRLCYVLTTRQMGKSSLMTRTAQQLKQDGVQTAIVDLTAIGTAPVDEWYVSMLDDIAWQLGLDTDLEAWWFEYPTLSPVRRFSKFMRQLIPSELNQPIAIFIDEVDSALKLPFSDDFFAAIRALFNRDSADQPPFSIILLGVAHPNDLIQDGQRTPFNVGERLRLTEFAAADAQPVLARGLPDVAAEVRDRILYWTDGHPYLTQKIALAVSRQPEQSWTTSALDQQVNRLFMTEQARIEDSNVQFVAGRIASSANRDALLNLYQRILRGASVTNDEASDLHNELKLYGLVKTDAGNHLRIRNRLYAAVFNKAWVAEQLPSRRSPWLVPMILLTCVVVALFAWNIQQQQQSQSDLIELNMAQFSETTDPRSQLASLGRIIDLGRPDVANDIFWGLQPAQQQALFESIDVDSSAAIVVVESVVGSLALHPIESTALLSVMAESLRQHPDSADSTLAIELDSWLRARSSSRAGNDEQARIEYSVAIALNPHNHSTRIERVNANLRVGTLSAVTEDLVWLHQQGGEWAALVAAYIEDNTDLQLYFRDNGEFEQLAALVPTMTSTIPSIQLPTSAITLDPASLAITTSTAQPAATDTQSASDTDTNNTGILLPTVPIMITLSATLVPPTSAVNAEPTATPTSAVAQLVDEPVAFEPAEPTGVIVYTCFVDGIDQLCAINADGGGQRQLTNTETTDWYGSIAADGSVLFSSLRAGRFGIYQLDSLNDDSAAIVTPAHSGDYAPELSPDGSTIVFTRVVDGLQQIWLINADGTTLRLLASAETDLLDPTWAPDGTQVAFAMRSADGRSYTHVIVNADGSGWRELPTPIDDVGGRSDWSPDGQWLTFYAGKRGQRNIYLVATDGSDVRQITTVGDNLAPAWSADGNWIVFTSYRDGDNELYIMHPDGSDVRQLTINDSADWQPRWQP